MIEEKSRVVLGRPEHQALMEGVKDYAAGRAPVSLLLARAQELLSTPEEVGPRGRAYCNGLIIKFLCFGIVVNWMSAGHMILFFRFYQVIFSFFVEVVFIAS